MRDILLLGIVLGVLPFAFRRPWVGVLLWTWFSIMNPHRLAYGFAYDLPFAAVAAGVTILALFTTREKVNLQWDPPVVVLFAFVIWMCLTTAFSFYPLLSWNQLNKVLKIQLMSAIALAALRERKHIELFIWVNILSIGFYGFKGGIFTIRSGGVERVWGPSGSFIEGNNELGLALIIVIPLMNYLRVVATRGWVRLGLLVLMLLSATSALGTQSRGAFLALASMGLVLWLRTKQKFVGGVFIALFAIALVAFMPASWEARMRTIETYEDDGSAMGRINAWKMGLTMANNTFFGGGFDSFVGSSYAKFAPDSPSQNGPHSIYFSVLGEHGWIGLILFLTLWVLAFRTAGAIRSEAKNCEETLWLQQLAGMCQVSLVGYLVGGTFLALAYFDLPYNILIILVVSLRWLREKRWEKEPLGAFGSVKPSSRIRATIQKGAQQWR